MQTEVNIFQFFEKIWEKLENVASLKFSEQTFDFDWFRFFPPLQANKLR